MSSINKVNPLTFNAASPQSWQLIFILQPSLSKWKLSVVKFYVKKNGELGRSGKIKLGYQNEILESEASQAESKAVQNLVTLYSQPQTHRGYYYPDYLNDAADLDFEIDYGADIGYIMNYLQRSLLMLNAGIESQKRLRVSSGPASLRFKLQKIAAKSGRSKVFRLFPEIESDGSRFELNPESRILTTNPIWILRKQQLICLENSLPAQFLVPFTQPDYQFQIPKRELRSFLREFLPHADHRLELDLPKAVNYSEKHALTGRRLYLKETGSKLLIELRFDYDEIEVPRSESKTVSIHAGSSQNQLWRVQRDLPAEHQAHDRLLVSGLELHGESDYAIKADPIEWMLEELPKLAEEGFEIYGEETLKRHRVNRSQPSVNLAVSSGIDWFDMNIEIDFDGITMSLSELRKSLRKKSSYVKLADGSLARMPDKWRKRFKHFLNFADEDEGKVRVSSMHSLLIDSLFDEAESKQYDNSFKKNLKRLRRFNGIKKVKVPAKFQGTLRPYQHEGLNWLGFLHDFGFNGCLADDMGLGKTVQALAHLARVHRRKRGKRDAQHTPLVSLIVAPLSVVFNWENECKRFVPHLKILIHHGTFRDQSCASFRDYDLILTTYATMRNDIGTMKDVSFYYIILDESQQIKNPVSQTARAARILHAQHRLVLTGTPVENNTIELWSQYSFLNPGMLGSLNYYREAFSTPIERYGDEDSASLLRKMISPFLLRRSKEQVVKELPPKTEQVLYCTMERRQQKLYERMRDKYRAEIMNVINETGIQDARFKVLQGLMKLRQIACHPAMLEESPARIKSGKFESFLDLLKEILAEGHKVLIFSQFVKMLNIISNVLDREKINYELLTGRTRKRRERVERFQQEDMVKVFLISLKAGGLGLNLTSADYVILFDPWWNPAAERQAIDRAHRIGQTKNVFAYKLITRESVEEKILELQARKEKLVSQLISTDSGLFKNLSVKDIEELFS